MQQVDGRIAARQPKERIIDRMVTTIKQALNDNPDSSILAFLPGQGEIRRTTDELADRFVRDQPTRIGGQHRGRALGLPVGL